MNKKFEIITAGLVVIVVIGAIIFANVKGTLNKGKGQRYILCKRIIRS